MGRLFLPARCRRDRAFSWRVGNKHMPAGGPRYQRVGIRLSKSEEFSNKNSALRNNFWVKIRLFLTRQNSPGPQRAKLPPACPNLALCPNGFAENNNVNFREPLKIHFGYERLRFSPASLSDKNRPRRRRTTAAAIFALRLAGENLARSRYKSNF